MTADDPETMVRAALRLDRAGRLVEAIAAYRRVVERWPQIADCWYRLGALERRSMHFDAALGAYNAALDRGLKRPEEAHLNRGVIYADDLRDYPAAEREFERALASNPRYLPALMNLGNLHEDLGRRERAIATYERILALDPQHVDGLARRANLHEFACAEDPLLARLRAAVARSGGDPAGRASLGFALGRALDACGAHEAAFAAYAAANRDSRASAPPDAARYDRIAHERFIDRLIGAFPARPAATAAMLGGTATAGAPRPIFVCGMFRSGSTLTEQLLAGHPRVAAGGEVDFLPRLAAQAFAPYPEAAAALTPAEAAAHARRYLELLARIAPGAEHVVDKRPDNFLHIGLIKTLLPQAKIVHTVRDPLDNCLSIYFLHLDQGMSYALDLEDIGHYYREYRRLMRHWKAIFGGDIVDFDYDGFVATPAATGARLLESLGLGWDERCLAPPAVERPVKTASVWQVREPIHRRSSGRAGRYAGQLAALRAVLDRGLY